MEKRLYRSRTDRMIGGVAGGLGHYFSVDPSLIRLAFVLLFVFGGSGFLLYLILWIVLPEEGRTYGSPEETARANAQEIATRAREVFGGSSSTSVEGRTAAVEPRPATASSGARLFAVILIAIGALFLLNNLFPGFWSFGQWWPVLLVLIGVAMLVGQLRK